MATKWNETRFTRELRQLLESEGALVHKNSERYHSGWPDLTVIMKGKQTFFMEVKVDGNEPTPLQWKTLRDIVKHGGSAVVVDYHNDTEEIRAKLIKKNEEEETWDSGLTLL